MPPEQFGGKCVPASDLYSLGATLIYLLTKGHPAELPQKDLRIQFEQVTQLSPEFSCWLGKMLEPSLDRRFSSAQIALQALKQPDLVNSDPLTGRKPACSKVAFTKDTDILQILLPPQGFSWESLWQNILLSLFCIPFLTSVSGNWLLVAVVIACGITSSCLFETFVKTRLRIDWDSISMSSEIFGLRFYESLSSPRQNITKLECIFPYVMCKEGSLESLDHYEYILPSIFFWTCNQKYVLSRLTLPEQDWLAHELSNWLEVPIEHHYLPIVKQTPS
jgi:serine/threonine protein kinase